MLIDDALPDADVAMFFCYYFDFRSILCGMHG